MKEKIVKLKEEMLGKIKHAQEVGALRELEVKYLGRKGDLTEVLRGLKDIKDENQRKEIGALANQVKEELVEELTQAITAAEGKNKKNANIDVTMPPHEQPRGHLHPITLVQNELEDLFISMGFDVLDGPELESDYYCFEALNIPPNHPARDMQDTFYIDKKNKDDKYDMIMRTQTSAVQVRAMQKYGAPLRCIIPGRCFRCEATDVRHEHTFYQLEGVMIDEGVNMSHMKSVLETMAKSLFGSETKIRLRPKFYPFVEPGFNGEVTCFLCHGEGCRLCKNSGWLEIFGAGLIHPNVLRAGKIDHNKYQGFAFGFGLNRIVQLKYNIEDVRLFNAGDLRFLEQF